LEEPSVNKQLSFIMIELLATGIGWILLVLSGFGILAMVIIELLTGDFIRDLVGKGTSATSARWWLLATILTGIIGWSLRRWGNNSHLLRSLAKEGE